MVFYLYIRYVNFAIYYERRFRTLELELGHAMAKRGSRCACVVTE